MHLRLRDFRNFARLDVDFAPGFHLLLGPNAQGKTNLLEAIYLVATLRSFRGVGGAQLVRHGQKGYFVGARFVGAGEHEVKLYWSPRERNVSLDSQPVRKLSDYFGVLRAVVFCTEDLQLVKGTARVRRRFLDLVLAQTRPGYLTTLQRYLRAVRARNALLRQHPVDEMALDSFSAELVPLAAILMQARRDLLPQLAPLAEAAYRRLAGEGEELRFEYRPSVKADFAVELAQCRERERTQQVTLVGPHRDDLQLCINDRPVAPFASEGQKRSVALALKMAQAEYLASVQGSLPVLLIDDVMGELDARRRAVFLPLLEQARQSRGQVFMTATEERWPAAPDLSLQRWSVRAGTLSPLAT